MRKIMLPVVLLCAPFLPIEAIELRAQNQAAPPASGAPAAQATSSTTDRLPGQRAEADRLRAIYDSLSADSMAEIDMLLGTDRCQILRVNGLLNRLKDAMNGWLTVEKQYWQAWNDKETTRVESEQKSLATAEADQTRAAELVESDKKDREELLRRRAALQQGPQTDAVRASMDALAADIQDSDARLAAAQKEYDAVTQKLNTSQAHLTETLVKIRQNLNTLDSYAVAVDASYETKRTAAQVICDGKTPDGKQVPQGQK
jgi:hypothetical protein